MIVAWKNVIVTAEYPCKWGRGAMLIDDKGVKYPASAGQLPKDFKIGDRFRIFVSGRGNGNLIEAIPVARAVAS